MSERQEIYRIPSSGDGTPVDESMLVIGRKNGSSSSRKQKRFDSVEEAEAAMREWVVEGFNVFWTALGDGPLSEPFDLVDGERSYI
ncbi:hypothetical protein [Streptomyces sp. CBMA156]|uniref:hypothetical protein n=1 Tax=Streptomyces sp. CBMA156 TaxID=1930280 RepID=UPI001661E595|nr:hypothetical protein [Streptomyces sp. CBMA156]MBD0670044.1 hypothetical protein [Streptomyces sp. CBMA156]